MGFGDGFGWRDSDGSDLEAGNDEYVEPFQGESFQ